MNCDECDALLIELVDGDLPSTQAAEVRAAAALCPDCQAQLERLEQAMKLGAALPHAPVPEQLTHRIMEVAHAHAAQAQATAIPSSGRVSHTGLLHGWLNDFVERFATGPQFAMATLMLLIAVGTFWAVPTLKRAPEAAGGSVVSVDTRGEAVASEVALEPADRLDLAVDMRHGRIRTKAEQRSLGRRRAPGATAPTAVAEANADVENDEKSVAEAGPMAFPQEAQSPAVAQQQAQPAGVLGGAKAEMAEMGAAPAAATAARMPTKKAKPKARSIPMKQAMDDAYAAEPPAPAPERRARVAQTPRATLQTAREARKSGDCAAAVVHYERVILAVPRGSLGEAAMREAAACYSSIGRARRARELESMLAQRENATPKGRKKSSKPVSAPAAAAYE